MNAVGTACGPGSAIVSVRGLSKQYRTYARPLDRLLQPLLGGAPRYSRFDALQDVSFDVMPGETLGIVGRNGSGKSTLLQLLVGTLVATEGEVRIGGRIAALLELGSGFNPDFTGRENILLNAALLGLERADIEQRLEAIIAFADIGEFIDQPLKNYSSGMVMRVAFSVVAHVDADILVIDEALAVGDAFFTQKCMRFLNRFRERGGTLLFVSHDSSAVTALCERALWLENGRMKALGPARAVMDSYLAELIVERQGGAGANPVAKRDAPRIRVRPRYDARQEALGRAPLRVDFSIGDFDPGSGGFGAQHLRVVDVALVDSAERQLTWVSGGEMVTLVVEVEAAAPVESVIVGFYVKDRLGQQLFGDNTFPSTHGAPVDLAAGARAVARFEFEMPRLQPGDYFVTIGAAIGTQAEHLVQHWVHEALQFQSHAIAAPFGLVGIPMHRVELAQQ